MFRCSIRSAIKTQAYSRHCFDGLPWGVMILWKCELVGIPSLRRSCVSEYCLTSRCKIGTTGLCFNYLFLESANRLAIVPSCNRRYSSFERTGVLDALGLHVFEKLRTAFCFFEKIKNCLGLGLVDCSSGAVVIIP